MDVVIQDIVDTYPKEITYVFCSDAHSIQKLAEDLVEGTPIGLSVMVNSDGCLEALALSTVKITLVFGPSKSALKRLAASGIGALAFHAFDIGPLLILVRMHLGVSLCGFDLSTMAFQRHPKASRGAIRTAAQCVNKAVNFYGRSNAVAANDLWNSFVGNGSDGYDALVKRAWLSAVTAAAARKDATAVALTTDHLKPEELKTLSKLVLEKVLLDSKKPCVSKNDFSEISTDKNGALVVHNTRYKNRLRGTLFAGS